MRSRLTRWITSRVAGSSDDTTAVPTAADVETFEAFLARLAVGADGYAAACNAGDIDAFCALLDEDFTQMPPDQPPCVGKAAVRERMAGLFAAVDLEDFTINHQDWAMFGDFAFLWGTYSCRTALQGQTPPVWSSFDGKYLSVVKKQTDGSWLAYLACFNSNVPGAELAL